VTSLWRNRDFVRLWIGESISLVGSEVSELALPLTAILVLGADAADLGLLGAARFAPFLLFTLPIGALADRRRRRPMLIVANIGRAFAIGSIPLLAAFDALTMPALFAAAFVVGSLTVLFDVTYLSYVPTVAGRDQLIEANTRLQASASAAAIGGPGLGGLLVQVLSAPVALVLDALSYVISAVNLLFIRSPEQEPVRERAARGLVAEVRDGFGMLLGHRSLRALAGVAGAYNLFSQWIAVLFVLFAVEELGLSAGLIGAVLASGAVGALIGAVLAGRAGRRLGLGRALVLAVTIECVAMLPLGFVAGPTPIVVVILFAIHVVNGCFVTMSSVLALAYRQAVAPELLLGRITAGYRFISYGAIPIGALLGGWAGESIGLRGGLIVGTIGLVIAVAFALLSPLRSVRALPETPEVGLERSA
jgi:MFS family permease